MIGRCRIESRIGQGRTSVVFRTGRAGRVSLAVHDLTLEPGVYYLTLEGFPEACGPFTLVVSR